MSVDDSKGHDAFQPEKKRRLIGYLWDTFDKPPAERRLLTKLDAALLCFGAVGYFVKSVDQYNINNAFVSGMKEDLGLFQNQLNYIQTAWSLGYMVGQIPSNIILSRARPRYWIPSLEVCWSVLTLSLSRCNHAYQFYIIRFLVGLCESGYYPGIQHSLGSWYRRDELGKRACILQTCSAVGQMVSGYMMSGVYHLGGYGGHKGWQWAYIIDGSISLPMAIAGFFLLPDVPEITKSWYLSEEVNNYATTTSAMQVFMTIVYAWLSDTVLKGSRWPPLVFGGFVNIICYVSLAVWNVPKWWKWTCFISAGAGYGLGGLCMAWANEVCERDSEERAITLAAMNELAYLLQIWLPLIVWQQVDAPRYFKGYITVSCMSVVLIVMTLVVRRLHNRERSTGLVRRHQGPVIDSCLQLQTHPHNLQQDEKIKGDTTDTDQIHTSPTASDLELAKSMAVVSTVSSPLSPVSSSSISTTPTVVAKESRHREVLSPTESVDIEMEIRPSRIV
ncbi:Pantothenate transporter liz1 [Talaromyces islandicus]|uniref:Pantothenate transporter liz1 n=1 Tax=Talaromyces islandicus TaxID=28573 RepID=A0A0U1LM36_TALIS|nr:Pantothenate transporter liz1 [Talaromyces islandicus]